MHYEKSNVVSGRSSTDNRGTDLGLSSPCERAEASMSAMGVSGEVAHTPGPWTRDERDARVWSPKGKLVALALGAGVFSEAEILANGYLLAAAPEMLDALNQCDNAFVSWQLGQIPGRPEDILALIVQVRGAIAKAKGRL